MGSVREHYNALVANNTITSDPAQLELAHHYDQLLAAINETANHEKNSIFSWLFKLFSRQQKPLPGLYIYGAVGRGKTMLMDMFFSCLTIKTKRRAHFNDFMADVHERINQHRQAVKRGEIKETDSVTWVAADLQKQETILCLDEFSVTDIADAMILSRLFSALFARGVILVATTNVAPDALYPNGLNRQLFLPFIATLKQHVDVINLDAQTDYRLQKVEQQPVYYAPLNHQCQQKMDKAWSTVTSGEQSQSTHLHVRGHTIEIAQAVGDAARFTFSDLCGKPLAAIDYLEIVKNYRTIFIDNVPVMDDEQRNEAKRFILLIDVLYDHHTRLFLSAATNADKLYQGRAQTTEKFEFDRTASRLFEMQSNAYLKAWENGDPRNR